MNVKLSTAFAFSITVAERTFEFSPVKGGVTNGTLFNVYEPSRSDEPVLRAINMGTFWMVSSTSIVSEPYISEDLGEIFSELLCL